MQLFALLLSSSVVFSDAGWATPLENSAKIKPGEREEIGKHAAARAQKAYAPTKSKVQTFLAMEANAEQVCPACDDKDYSDMCPLDWADELSDGRCKAPATYAGRCSKVQMLLGSSAAEKMELEIACGLCWPCTKGGEEAATCVRDWAQPCPQGYAPQDIPYNEFREASGITCMAELFYEGQCEQQVAFQDLYEKKDFVERCQTSWPCRRTCEEGYAACPSGWQVLGSGLCSAPDAYKVSGCPLLQSFRGWTDDMKGSFAQKCSVGFECADDTNVGECQLNLSACPRHWQQEGSRCLPPPDMRGACATAWDMDSKSAREKIAWASECGMNWPCAGESSAEMGAPRMVHISTGRAGPVDASGSIVGA